jgi:large subunit ribosomal protein L16
VFGDFGLQAVQGGWIRAQTIEAGRIAAQQYVRGEGRLYIRIFPHKPTTARPLETRMGKGKGEPEYWVAVIKPGTVMFELGGGDRGPGSGLFCPFGAQDANTGSFGPASAGVR